MSCDTNKTMVQFSYIYNFWLRSGDLHLVGPLTELQRAITKCLHYTCLVTQLMILFLVGNRNSLLVTTIRRYQEENLKQDAYPIPLPENYAKSYPNEAQDWSQWRARAAE